MADTYSSRLGLTKSEIGADIDTWGTDVHTFLDSIDEAIAGVYSLTLSGTTSLSITDGATDSDRKAVLLFTSGTGGTVTLANKEKIYRVRNGCSGKLTFTAGSGLATCIVPPGASATIFTDGSNHVYVINRGPWTYITSGSASGTALSFETTDMDSWSEFLFAFTAFSHNNGAGQQLRMGITDTPGTYTMTNLGSYVAADFVYGAVRLIARSLGNIPGTEPPIVGSHAVVALGALTTAMTLGTAGAVYPVRFGAALAGVRFDFSGATLDSGTAYMYAR